MTDFDIEVTPGIQNILEAIELDPLHSTETIFLSGMLYERLQHDATKEILTWNKGAVTELVTNLLESDKLSFTDVITAYTKNLERLNAKKQSLIMDLASSLMMYRKHMYSKNDLEGLEEKSDKALRETNMFNY